MLQDKFDERGVGHPHLARALNIAMYSAMERAVIRAMRSTGSRQPPGRVLDVGSGSGFWIEFWQRQGAMEITGADLTTASVQKLRRRWPNHSFLQADIGEADAGLPPGHEVVSAMSVLLHIVDDGRFQRAFQNLAAALRPQGILIVIEPVVVHRYWGPPFGIEAASKARALADYRVALEAAGLELLALCPTTVLFNNVVDTRTAFGFRTLEIYWELLMRIVGSRERLGRTASAVLSPADRLMTSMARTGPSAKVLVACRAG